MHPGFGQGHRGDEDSPGVSESHPGSLQGNVFPLASAWSVRGSSG